MSFCKDYEKILEKYKAIWTKIEDLFFRQLCLKNCK